MDSIDHSTASQHKASPVNLTTPLVVHFCVLMVVLIYAGYAIYFFSADITGLFVYLADISFELFLASQVWIVLLTISSKRQLEGFLERHPAISDSSSLERFKAVARMNMYYALVFLLLLGLGSLAAVMSILNYGGITAIAVLLVAFLTGSVTRWASSAESRIKQINCTDATLEEELRNIFYCWQHRPFPNF